MSAAALQASPAKPPTPHRIVRPPRLVPAEEIDHDSSEGRRHFYEHVCRFDRLKKHFKNGS